MKRFVSRLVSVLMACALLLGMAAPSFSAEITSGQLFEFLTQDNPDYTSVTALEDDILKELRSLAGFDRDIPESLTPSYADAYKLYTNTQILSMDTTDEGEIRTALEDGTYFWIIPFPNINGYSYNVPVFWDGETWDVGYVEEYEEGDNPSYTVSAAQRIDQLPQGDYTAVLVGGLTHIQQPVAVVFENGEARYIVESRSPIPLEGTEKQKQRLLAEGTSESDGIFQYDKIAQVVNNMPPPNPDLMGGVLLDTSYLDGSPNQLEWYIPVGLGLAGLLVIALIVTAAVRRRRQSSR